MVRSGICTIKLCILSIVIARTQSQYSPVHSSESLGRILHRFSQRPWMAPAQCPLCDSKTGVKHSCQVCKGQFCRECCKRYLALETDPVNQGKTASPETYIAVGLLLFPLPVQSHQQGFLAPSCTHPQLRNCCHHAQQLLACNNVLQSTAHLMLCILQYLHATSAS